MAVFYIDLAGASITLQPVVRSWLPHRVQPAFTDTPPPPIRLRRAHAYIQYSTLAWVCRARYLRPLSLLQGLQPESDTTSIANHAGSGISTHTCTFVAGWPVPYNHLAGPPKKGYCDCQITSACPSSFDLSLFTLFSILSHPPSNLSRGLQPCGTALALTEPQDTSRPILASLPASRLSFFLEWAADSCLDHQVPLHRGMAPSDYEDSPRSSRRSRKSSRHIPPAVPEVPSAPGVDWPRNADESPSPPPRRRRTERDRNRRKRRDSDWDLRHDEEVLLRTPESQTSSSSYHLSRHRHYSHETRRDQSTTPSHSIASSMTSVLTPHPPRSSMTRLPNVVYRRPSLSIREAASGYDNNVPRESGRSRSRSQSTHIAPSTPISRRPSRNFVPVSDPSSGSESEETEDAYEDRARSRSRGETRLVRCDVERRNRGETVSRSRSRAMSRRRASRHDLRVRETSVSSDDNDGEGDEDEEDEGHDLIDARYMPAVDPGTVRLPLRPMSRSRSRAASVRHIQGTEGDHDHDADSEEPPVRELRDRFERKKSHKHRHASRTPRERGRDRDERQSSSRYPPPSKRYVLSASIFGVDPGSSGRVRSSSRRYYESEQVTKEKPQKRHPPSSSHRRSNTIGGPGSVGTASQHQSVSSSIRRSSAFFGNFFGSSPAGHPHHGAPDKPVKM